MNNFLYLISDLHLCHLPIMSPPFPMFLRWTSEFQLPWAPSLPLSVTMSVFLSLPPCLCGWLSRNLVEASFMCVQNTIVFYEMNVNTILEHLLLFSWDTQPGAECLFDHSPFPYSKYLHFRLWGPNRGDGVCETCGFLSRSLAERSSTWSWCRWSCPEVLCSWNHWRIPDLGGNTQMKNAVESWSS